MAYACEVLADSVSPAGHRLTTFQVTFPRIVLAEVNTHKMLSKNSASSRAIPVPKRIAAVEADPFVPDAFGQNKPGMQHEHVLEGDDDEHARRIWARSRQSARADATELSAIGVHKQLANRLLEPHSWHTAIISGTDWANYFGLRCHTAAQGEFRKAAELMREAMRRSRPHLLRPGEWHLPLVPELDGEVISRADARRDRGTAWWLDWVKISSGRCARVSYLTHDGVRDIDKDVELADSLVTNGHLSPTEHQARPMAKRELALTAAYDVTFDGGLTLRVGSRWGEPRVGGRLFLGTDGDEPPESELIVAVRGPLHYAGNFNGWVQYRKHIPNEWNALGGTD